MFLLCVIDATGFSLLALHLHLPLSRLALSLHICIGVLINNACVVMMGG